MLHRRFHLWQVCHCLWEGACSCKIGAEVTLHPCVCTFCRCLLKHLPVLRETCISAFVLCMPRDVSRWNVMDCVCRGWRDVHRRRDILNTTCISASQVRYTQMWKLALGTHGHRSGQCFCQCMVMSLCLILNFFFNCQNLNPLDVFWSCYLQYFGDLLDLILQRV